MTLAELSRDLRSHASSQRALLLSRYFKTAPGQYGAGDTFIGVTVPQVRTVVRRYRGLPLSDAVELLRSPVHEERLCALLLMVDRYNRGEERATRSVVHAYLRNRRCINNWDLVDLSAPNILGDWLLRTKSSGAVLVRLARSRNLWERRIAILSTFAFIGAGRYVPTFNVARLLLTDGHDLIHKAVGWALREVGKRIDQETEEEFLRRHYRTMPRTMLRYAIERFPGRLRQAYLHGRVGS
jgi:3-methyladenine DNA glycosylase AlkD